MVTKKRYLRALRKGEYDQWNGGLRGGGILGGYPAHCCIGVYCDLAAPEAWAPNGSFNAYAGGVNALDSHYAIRDFGTTLGLHPDTPFEVITKIQVHMIHMNDGIGDFEGNPHSFEMIADWIENDLEGFIEELYGDLRYTRA